MPPPVVSIVGLSGSGKTTFLEKLLAEFALRGYRVATAKHVSHKAHFDKPGKDSWRHIEAGSKATAISADEQVVIIRPVPKLASLEEVARLLGDDYDIILAEGFKQEDAPKIEVHRREVGKPLEGLKGLMAIITDEPLQAKVRQFGLEDVKPVADLLEKGFILPRQERLSVYINGQPLVLKSFPRDIAAGTLEGIFTSFKGAENIKSLEVSFKKPPAKDES